MVTNSKYYGIHFHACNPPPPLHRARPLRRGSKEPRRSAASLLGFGVSDRCCPLKNLFASRRSSVGLQKDLDVAAGVVSLLRGRLSGATCWTKRLLEERNASREEICRLRAQVCTADGRTTGSGNEREKKKKKRQEKLVTTSLTTYLPNGHHRKNKTSVARGRQIDWSLHILSPPVVRCPTAWGSNCLDRENRGHPSIPGKKKKK